MVSFYTTTQFFMFLKEVSSAQQGCIYLIKKNSKNIITIQNNYFLF